MTEQKVVIVGGGLAGLFTASELLASGVQDVVVLDGGSQPGGIARTIDADGYQLEPAAGTLLLPHPHLSPVLGRFAAEIVPAVGADVRYVFIGGKLIALAASPRAALAPVVPWTDKARAVLEPFRRATGTSADESLDTFLRRRLGNGLGRTLAWIAASGVFAGDPARLSARAAFPGLPALEDTAGSIVRGAVRGMRARQPGAVRPTSHVVTGGMSALAAEVSSRLGDRYRQTAIVESIRSEDGRWIVDGAERFDAAHVVVATRPTAAAKLLTGELSDLLGLAVSAPAVVVGLGGPSKTFPIPHGFGALVGPDENMVTLGALFESSYAPGRAPVGHSLVKVIAGGATRPDIIEWDDDRMIETIGGEVSRILGQDVSASFVRVARHREGIPQYNVGHLRWIQELDRHTSAMRGLHLTGWGYRGVGVAHVAADAAAIAGRVAST